MHRNIFFCLLILITIFGCSKKNPPSYPTWFTQKSPYVSRPGSHNAFDDYTLAASDAEKLGHKYLNRTLFTPGMKKHLINTLQEPLNQIEQAKNKKSDFQFRALPPFQAAPYQKGWQLLGKTLCWKIELLVFNDELDDAISLFLSTSKFGFDLTEGAAIDLSLGLTIVNTARLAIIPGVHKMSKEQLSQLAGGIITILKNRPSIEKTLLHEQEQMMAAVQVVQDAIQKKDFSELRKQLGSSVNRGIKFINKKLLKKSYEKKIAYLNGFANEGKSDTNKLIIQLKLPTIKREKIEKSPKAYRPWKRFAMHFFSSAQTILPMNDRTVAKTRLLALQALLQKEIKEHDQAPDNLDKFPGEVTLDPYSGQQFVYQAGDLDFKIYSIGEDLRDDGGQTDETGTGPDLLLERVE